MSAIISGKVVCDCRRCAELPEPKKLGKRQWQNHRKIYGIRDSFSSTISIVANSSSNISQEPYLPYLDLRILTNTDLSRFDDEPAIESTSFLTETDLLQSNEQTLANNGEDLLE